MHTTKTDNIKFEKNYNTKLIHIGSALPDVCCIQPFDILYPLSSHNYDVLGLMYKTENSKTVFISGHKAVHHKL